MILRNKKQLDNQFLCCSQVARTELVASVCGPIWTPFGQVKFSAFHKDVD